MPNDKKNFTPDRMLSIFLLFFAVILISYSNTFHASWHLDDYPNITQNSGIHISDLTFDSLYKTFFGHPQEGSMLFRPVVYFSLGLNWYLGKNNVVGYHIFNIFIHFLTTCFLFLTILALCRTPNLKNKLKGKEAFVAFWATILWAVNPIHTQAVTYIVQRMAIMAAMFYISGIFFFLNARMSESGLKKTFFCICCLLSFLLAIGSKQNSATFPLAILLVEIIFFQNLSHKKTRKKLFQLALAIGFICAISGVFFFMGDHPFSFLDIYKQRSFSLLERLLTEPRIVVFYISQIFYPIPQRLSIEHDFNTSTSLFDPLTTMPAILFIFILVATGFFQMQKRPLLAFGILFFFLNHIIESSIIPLELVFEHRNYLPSLFLFLPIASGLKWLIDYEKNPLVPFVVKIFIPFLIMILASGTFVRNYAWATESTLWIDAMEKAPARARTLYNLAKFHYKKTNRPKKALELFARAAEAKASSPSASRALCLNAMADIYYENHEYDKTIMLCKKALDLNPLFIAPKKNLILTFLKQGNANEALKYADLFMNDTYNNEEYPYYKGLPLLMLNKPKDALPYLIKAYNRTPNDMKIVVKIAYALSLTGEYKQAEDLLKMVYEKSRDLLIYFCLIENSKRAQNTVSMNEYLIKLFEEFSLGEIKNKLRELSNKEILLPMSHNFLSTKIANKLKDISGEINALSLSSDTRN